MNGSPNRRNLFSQVNPKAGKLSTGLSFEHMRVTEAIRDSDVDLEINESGDQESSRPASPERLGQMQRSVSTKSKGPSRIEHAISHQSSRSEGRPIPLVILNPTTRQVEVSQQGLSVRNAQPASPLHQGPGRHRSNCWKISLRKEPADEPASRARPQVRGKKVSQIQFKVSARAEACTQGLWVWGQPIINQKTKTTVLLVDSEGSGAVDKNETHDAKIFALVVLIASLFIYNSFGVIDEKAIESLSLAAKLSRNIHFSRDQDDAQPQEDRLAEIAPRFVWLLRDFFLDLRDEFNNPITENQYLEKSLAHDGGLALSEKTKQIRLSLLKIFRDRQCFTFPRPVEDQEDLQRLNTIPLDHMRPQFKEKVELLKGRVQGCPSKQINGTYLTGPIIAGLVQGYARALNEGVVPDLGSEWEHIREQQTREAFAEIQRKISEDFKTLKGSVLPDKPFEEEELYKELLHIQQLGLKFMHKQFMKLDLGPHSINQSLFQSKAKEIDNLLARQQLEVISMNEKYAKRLNQNLANTGFAPIEEAMSMRKYDEEEKASALREDIETMVGKYKHEARGASKLPVFADSLTGRLTKIVETVQQMSQKRIKRAERELEVLQQETGDKLENLEGQVSALERENENLRNARVKLRAELTTANEDAEMEKEERVGYKEKCRALENQVRALKEKVADLEEQLEPEEDEDEEEEGRRRSTKIKPPPKNKKTTGCQGGCALF